MQNIIIIIIWFRGFEYAGVNDRVSHRLPLWLSTIWLALMQYKKWCHSILFQAQHSKMQWPPGLVNLFSSHIDHHSLKPVKMLLPVAAGWPLVKIWIFLQKLCQTYPLSKMHAFRAPKKTAPVHEEVQCAYLTKYLFLYNRKYQLFHKLTNA